MDGGMDGLNNIGVLVILLSGRLPDIYITPDSRIREEKRSELILYIVLYEP